MRWWAVRGHDREVSRSMVALVVSASAALALGLTTWAPRLAARDIGVAPAEPSLLTVAPAAEGAVALGDGVTVELYRSGLRLRDREGVLADTVTRGAPVSALLGSVEEDAEEGHPRERVGAALGSAGVDAVTTRPLDPGRREAVYTGSVQGEVDGRPRSLPLTIAVAPVAPVAPAGAGALVRVTVPGADGLVLHLDSRPAVTGIPPALPDRNLRLRAWWLSPAGNATATFTWVLGSRVGLGPAGAPRAVDLRPDGRIALHVWAPTATLSVVRVAPPP
ncbi:MAG TPA: hypothetical protein VES95_10070 [Dermatophilaceae bacterium]|nr:hypothetical protein [Dermatophilaceae bacterium]